MDYKGYNTIYDYLTYLDIPDGMHSMQLANDEIIPFEIYNYTTDIILDTSPTLGDSVPDTKMLILKYHKNLNIHNNVLFTPQVRKKGMVIFCKGFINNYGTISMTARGASADGQDVLLYQNNDDSYEYVPKVGALGSDTNYVYSGNASGDVPYGKKGYDGSNRQTGGGGGGGVHYLSSSSGRVYVARGGYGTSYSGGAGSGGIATAYEGNSFTWYGNQGSDTGGAGGDSVGAIHDYAGHGGGVGNPTGTSVKVIPNAEGTGGLLIIYGYTVLNHGTIEARGCPTVANCGSIHTIGYQNYGSAGGSSGGGSINIFYKSNYINNGTISAIGGLPYQRFGGNGGNGTVTVQKIVPRTYYLIKNDNKYRYYKDDKWHTLTVDNPNVEDYLTNGMRNLSSLTKDAWSKLKGKTNIMLMTYDGSDINNLFAKVLYKPQLLIMNTDIKLPYAKEINYIKAEDIDNKKYIRRLISIDRGSTWLYYKDGWKQYNKLNDMPSINTYPSKQWTEWLKQDHLSLIADIKKIGLTSEQLSSTGLLREQWLELFKDNSIEKHIRFITLIDALDIDNISTANSLSVNYKEYETYTANNNYKQVQKTNEIVITPSFNATKIKINYIL